MAHRDTLRAHCARQINNETLPTFRVPLEVTLSVDDEIHRAQILGEPIHQRTRTQLVKRYTTFTANGGLTYSLLPLLYHASFDSLVLSSEQEIQYWSVPNATSLLTPHVWHIGSSVLELNNSSSTIRLIDTHLQSMKLSANINSPMVALESSWFGNMDGDFSEFVSSGDVENAQPLPTDMELVNGLQGSFYYETDLQDGVDPFASMTQFDCALLDWSMTIESGRNPGYSLDANKQGFCIVRKDPYKVTFDFTVRSKDAVLARAAQEGKHVALKMDIFGSDDRNYIQKMYGTFTQIPNPLEKGDTEIVQKFQFVTEVPWNFDSDGQPYRAEYANYWHYQDQA